MIPDYTLSMAVAALKAAGVARGDVVFSHSNVGFFGLPDCPPTAEGIYALWKTAFAEVLGPEGTVVFPTFSYSFCHGEPFDPRRTPGTCGLLSEFMRCDPDAVRSDDANFSVAVIGAKAWELTHDVPEKSFGPGCFFDRFLSADGKFVNLNVHPATTFLHYIEAVNGVPYRWHKPFHGILQTESGDRRATFWHFVYDLDIQDHAPDFTRFNHAALSAGVVRTSRLGRGQIVSISAADTKTVLERGLSKDISFLLKGKYHG